tara:strand:+ start:218 stop:1057 length:840 start_codon:yes stop_codon:yes gene_type:complete
VDSVGQVYTKSDNKLYFQDGAGVEHLLIVPSFASFTFAARSASSGEHYVAGFYTGPASDANLDEGSLTVTHGGANHPYAAHAYLVGGGDGNTDGSDLAVTVTGTSITDGGTRTTSDSEVLVSDARAWPASGYAETTKKWLGTVTYTLSSTGGGTFNFSFNYGFAKYDDMGNRDFTITDFEAVGLANANDSGFNIELLHHETTGWTYHATAFQPGGTVLLDMNTIHSTEQDIDNGEHFAFKRDSLSQAIDGDGSEGFVIRVTTGANNAVSYLNFRVGMTF